jgi:AraC-like DNA-binding protein
MTAKTPIEAQTDRKSSRKSGRQRRAASPGGYRRQAHSTLNREAPATTEEIEILIFGRPLSELVAAMNRDLRLQRLIAVVQAQYEDLGLTVAKAAAQAGLHKAYLGALVRSETGLTIRQLIAGHRLLKVVRSAKIRDRKALTLALDAGFGSPSSFVRNFKRVFGITLTEFRKRTANLGGPLPTAPEPRDSSPLE